MELALSISFPSFLSIRVLRGFTWLSAYKEADLKRERQSEVTLLFELGAICLSLPLAS